MADVRRCRVNGLNVLKIPIAGVELEKSRSVEEIVLLSMSAVALLAILPFGFVRVSQGDWNMAIVDFAMVAMLVGLGIYVYTTRNIKGPVLILCLALSLGMQAVVYLKGASIVYWAFPATVILFLVLPWRAAMIINVLSLILLAIILSQGGLDAPGGMSKTSLIVFIIAFVLTNGAALIFALQSRKQRQALRDVARRDPLTGAGNRRSFDEKMEEAIASVRRYKTSVSLLSMDIDFFKKINDQWGHGVGDEALIRMCQVLQKRLRPTDHLYRVGGEEFAVIAFGTNAPETVQFAERLRELVANSKIIEQRQVTISVGVAQITANKDVNVTVEADIDAVMRRVDKALYAAKESGRNCVKEAIEEEE